MGSTDDVMPGGITRRLIRDGDEEQILDVLNAAFERWPKAEIDVPQIDHLRWKMNSHPDVRIRMGVGELNGRVVVASINIRQEAKFADRIVVAYQSADAAIMPEYQNIGFSKAARDTPMPENERALEGVDLGFSVGRAHPAFERMRASDPNPMPRVERNLEALLRTRGPVTEPAATLAWQVRVIEAFDERVDELWEEASRPFCFMLVRKRDYLNWRYCDRRAGPFTVKIAEQDGRILGYLVRRISYGRGHIADLLVLPGRLDVAESLLADAVRDLETNHVESTECWSYEHHPYWVLLQQYGFVHKRRTMKAAFTLSPKSTLQGVDLRRVRHRGSLIQVMSGDTDLV